jgi:hypothetical protein
MKSLTALSGKETTSSSLDLQNFTKAFIAGLVARDLVAVRPQDPADRKGFASVVEVLDKKIQELENLGTDKTGHSAAGSHCERTASKHYRRIRRL